MSRTVKRKDGFFIGSNSIFFIDLELSTYKRYISSVEEHFKSILDDKQKEFNRLENELKNNKDKYDPEYYDYLHDSLIDSVIEVNDSFIQNFRSSIVIQLFSFLEIELRKACERHQSKNNKDFGVNDLKGSNDIDKIKKYLTKSVGININDLSPEWLFFNNLRKVRNVVVHHNSIIESHKNDFNAINQFKNNRFNLKERTFKDRFVIVFDTPEFLDEVMKNIAGLFEKLNEYKVY